jgi:VIT1/CCC1 family predicted Fe2+/Mn2+ transporter
MVKKVVLEGEIVDKSPLKRESTSISQTILPEVNLRAFWPVAAGLVPVIGLITVAIVFLLARLRRQSIIIPLIALIISLFVTGTFLVLRFILKAIF